MFSILLFNKFLICSICDCKIVQASSLKMSCGLKSSVLHKTIAAASLFSSHKVVNITKCCPYTFIFYKCRIVLIALHSFNSYWLSFILAILQFCLGCCCICRSIAFHMEKKKFLIYFQSMALFWNISRSPECIGKLAFVIQRIFWPYPLSS